MIEELKSMISDNEKIYWEGKPNKKCFIFETIFNPMLPVALLWGAMDFLIIGVSIAAKEDDLLLTMLFFALHLIPVWMYLGGILFCARKYRNTYYIVTDKNIYVSSGVFVKHLDTKPFAEMSHTNLHRGVFDQMFNVGDIICTTDQRDVNGRPVTFNIRSVSNTQMFSTLLKNYNKIFIPMSCILTIKGQRKTMDIILNTKVCNT